MTEPVSPADTIRRALDAFQGGGTMRQAAEAALDALLAVGERDRRQIARLTEATELAVEKIEYAQETATGWLTYRAAMQDALAYLRAVLAGEEDARP